MYTMLSFILGIRGSNVQDKGLQTCITCLNKQHYLYMFLHLIVNATLKRVDWTTVTCLREYWEAVYVY